MGVPSKGLHQEAEVSILDSYSGMVPVTDCFFFSSREVFAACCLVIVPRSFSLLVIVGGGVISQDREKKSPAFLALIQRCRHIVKHLERSLEKHLHLRV